MKHPSLSSVVTIHLALLAATAAFVPSSDSSRQRRLVTIPSFSSLSFPATTTTARVWHMRTSNEDERGRSLQHKGVSAISSNIFAAASISMAVMTLAETAVLPANAVDDSTKDIQTTTTTASTTSTTVENSLKPSTGTSPTLFEYFKKNRVEVVTSTSTERPIQTSPTILQYLQKKVQKDREEAVAIKDKPKEEKKSLLPSFVKKFIGIFSSPINKVIFLTGTAGTIYAMYYVSYEYYKKVQLEEKKKKA